MPGNVCTVNLAVGTMAALLTALEYALSTVSALSVRATLHGFWLRGLHRGGTAPLDIKQRVKRAFRKDIASAVLGIWLVVGVALVESNLKPGFLLSDQVVNSTECVSMYGKYRPERITKAIPPYRTTIEPWVLKVSETIDCGNRGIASIGVGGATDSYGEKQNMSAPVCNSEVLDVRSGIEAIQVSLTAIEVEDFYLQPDLESSDAFTLFPHNCSNIGLNITSVLHGSDGTGPCGKRGISRFFASTSPSLQTTFAHALNISLALHERMCALHGNRSVVPLPDEIVRSCIDDEYINGQCLRSSISPELLHSAKVTDVAALFVKRSQSYACPSATVEQDYVFINPVIITELESSAKATLPVLVVTSARVISGHCEPTVGVLGQAALLFSADSSWRKDQLSTIDKRTLYYAYMMAVSCSQFPLNTIKGTESPTFNFSCYVRPVTEVTEIAVDWRLFILISGLACALLTIVLGMLFRMIYTGESWSVGSAQWSLSRLLYGERDGNGESRTLIEVTALPVAEENSADETWAPSPASSGMSPQRDKRKCMSSESSTLRKPGDTRYQYIVRTVRKSFAVESRRLAQTGHEEFTDSPPPSQIIK